MTGQKQLLDEISRLAETGFPKSSLLVGAIGCGKSTLIEEIARLLGIDIIDATSQLSYDFIDRCSLSPEPHIYKINAWDIGLKGQNSILKFLEEPSDNTYIMIECREYDEVLETVRNRCHIFEFGPYSEDELAEFGDRSIVKYCSTPGQMAGMNDDIITDLKTMAKKLADSKTACKASIQNMLSIKDKAKPYGYDMFLRVLIDESLAFCLKNDDLYANRLLKEANNTLSLMKVRQLSQDNLMISLLCSAWLGMRDKTWIAGN